MASAKEDYDKILTVVMKLMMIKITNILTKKCVFNSPLNLGGLGRGHCAHPQIGVYVSFIS